MPLFSSFDNVAVIIRLLKHGFEICLAEGKIYSELTVSVNRMVG